MPSVSENRPKTRLLSREAEKVIFILNLLSRLPYFILHRISDGLFYLLYYGLRYRRKVVRENLERSFPEKSEAEITGIEKKFYRNFGDVMVESIKNFTISREELRDRCRYLTPEVTERLYAEGKSISGFSSHLASWETLPLSACVEFEYQIYAVYKPLQNQKFDQAVSRSRGRFGAELVPIKSVRKVIDSPQKKPFLLGLLSDQAPHDYARAFEVQFLNQRTFVTPGAAILAVERGFTPAWGWMRRTGRSRVEWGIEELIPKESPFTDSEKEQITRIACAHSLTEEKAGQALRLVQEFSRRLEDRIKMAPQDWLWSHRRWKSR